MKKYIVFFLLFTGCAGLNSDEVSCLNETEVNLKKKFYETEAFKEDFPKQYLNKSKWVLLKNQCSKRYYKYGKYIHVLIFRDPETLEVNGQYRNAPFDIGSTDCLSQAVSEVKALKVEWAGKLFKKAKIELGDRWDDKLVGPVSFLKCKGQSEKNPTYVQSISTFVHEVTHYASKDCLYNLKKSRGNCALNRYKYEVLSELSPRKMIKIKNTRVDLSSMAYIQEKYLNSLNKYKRPVQILNEMQAYTIGLEVADLYVEQHSLKSMPSSATSFFAMYDLAKRMKELIETNDPSFSKKSIGKETQFYLNEARLIADKYFQSCNEKTRGKLLRCKEHSLWKALK